MSTRKYITSPAASVERVSSGYAVRILWQRQWHENGALQAGAVYGGDGHGAGQWLVVGIHPVPRGPGAAVLRAGGSGAAVVYGGGSEAGRISRLTCTNLARLYRLSSEE